MKPSIEIEIDQEANVKIEAVGYTGQACDLATKALQEAMGQTVKDVKKPEYHQRATSHQKVGGA